MGAQSMNTGWPVCSRSCLKSLGNPSLTPRSLEPPCKLCKVTDAGGFFRAELCAVDAVLSFGSSSDDQVTDSGSASMWLFTGCISDAGHPWGSPFMGAIANTGPIPALNGSLSQCLKRCLEPKLKSPADSSSG